MTTDHEEAVRLVAEFGWRIPHPYNDKVTANIFTDAELAALIAEVRRKAMEEAAVTCELEMCGANARDHETDLAHDRSLRKAAKAIRAKLEEGK